MARGLARRHIGSASAAAASAAAFGRGGLRL